MTTKEFTQILRKHYDKEVSVKGVRYGYFSPKREKATAMYVEDGIEPTFWEEVKNGWYKAQRLKEKSQKAKK
jgi:hypothetical protein|nr:MAG TPA: hypothetical protein [Caudoviricetes sp.]